jgi:D-alanine-D-alanine ligase
VSRVVVLHNADFDFGDGGAASAVDATSVAEAARAVADALATRGFEVAISAVRGVDATRVIAAIAAEPPALVFNLCESLAGDPRHEATLAGLLALHGLRYTGNDQLALATCLDKVRCKHVLLGAGVATPPHRAFETHDDLDDDTLDALDYPWFVKPARSDASVGITERNVVRDAAALRERTRELLAELAQPVLAERYVDGREVNIGFVAEQILPLHEIDFAAMPGDRPKIVSYAAKWEAGHVDYAGTKAVPLGEASPHVIEQMQAVATAAYRALGLRGYGRVDLRVDRAGRPWVIDVNPNCDVSPDAGLARAAAAAGMPYPAMVEAIARAALTR